MKQNGTPDKVTMDKSGASRAAIDAINAGSEHPILVWQVKYLNNIVEHDHRAIRITRPMLGFQSYRAVRTILAGIALMHMIRQGQFAIPGVDEMSFANQFDALQRQGDVAVMKYNNKTVLIHR